MAKERLPDFCPGEKQGRAPGVDARGQAADWAAQAKLGLLVTPERIS